MTSSVQNIKNEEEELSATKVLLTEEAIIITLEDGREVSTPLAFYPSLLKAPSKDRAHFELFGMGTGITWPTLDIDLEVAGVVAGRKEIPGLMDKFEKFKAENKLPT